VLSRLSVLVVLASLLAVAVGWSYYGEFTEASAAISAPSEAEILFQGEPQTWWLVSRHRVEARTLRCSRQPLRIVGPDRRVREIPRDCTAFGGILRPDDRISVPFEVVDWPESDLPPGHAETLYDGKTLEHGVDPDGSEWFVWATPVLVNGHDRN
jgi:hypothetical protein